MDDIVKLTIGEKIRDGSLTVVGFMYADIFVSEIARGGDISNWNKLYPDWQTKPVVMLESATTKEKLVEAVSDVSRVPKEFVTEYLIQLVWDMLPKIQYAPYDFCYPPKDKQEEVANELPPS